MPAKLAAIATSTASLGWFALGASVGGAVGAPVARRLPAAGLRGLIVVVGVIAAVVSLRGL